jgi:hypothetical protein
VHCGCKANFTKNISLIYFLGGFANEGHFDNDINIYATGIWSPVDKEGNIATKDDGYDGDGFRFYIAPYKVAIDFNDIDGFVEAIWRGKSDLHGTTTGRYGENSDRHAITCQLAKRLDQRVRKALYDDSKGYRVWTIEGRLKQLQQR